MRYSRQWCSLLFTLGLLTLRPAFLHSAVAADDPVCLEWDIASPGGSVIFSPDGRWLAAMSVDQVAIWDASTKEKIATYINRSSDSLPHSIAFSPDSRHLAILGEAGRVCLRDGTGGWADAPEREILDRVVDRRGLTTSGWSGHSVEDVVFSPDGTLLAVCRHEVINILELEGSESIAQLESAGSAHSPQFADQGKTLVVGVTGNLRQGHFVEFWSMETFELKNRVPIQPSPHVGEFVQPTPNRRSLASASVLLAPTEEKLAVLLQNPNTTCELRLYELPGWRWATVALEPRLWSHPSFSPDGRLLAIGTVRTPGKPAKVLVRDLKAATWRRFECPPEIAGENLAFRNTKFSPDGRYLAAGLTHPQVAVCIWDLEAESDTDKPSRSRY